MDVLSRRRELRDALRLALVPIGVASVFGVLLVPHRAVPEEVPLPIADLHALQRTQDEDARLADLARAQPLPGPVRALGSAMRDFHVLEAHDADAGALSDARKAVDQALIDAAADSDGLLRLRAAQLSAFLREVKGLRSTGQPSPELQALGGAFVRSMAVEGWWDGHVLLPDERALRPMFKQMWSAFLGLDGRPAFQLSTDEQRALYAFYLAHPHPSRTMREALDAARRGAHDPKACLAIAEAERSASESWRLERIARLATVDPEYPAAYARGVASFRRGDYDASAQAFRLWLRDHPDGPYALRALNYLHAAVDADRVE